MMGAWIASSTPGQTERMKQSYSEMEKNVKLIAFGGRIDKEGHSRLLTRLYANPQSAYARWLARAGHALRAEIHSIALFLQRPPDERGDFGLVFDDENTHRPSWSLYHEEGFYGAPSVSFLT